MEHMANRNFISNPVSRTNLTAVAVVATLWIAGCGDGLDESSLWRGTLGNLSMEFRAACLGGDLVLKGALENTSREEIRIESGALPWDSDVLGTEFHASVDGKELAQHSVAPIVDRFSALVLAPRERREGMVPILDLFPEMKMHLGNRPIRVTWKYEVSRGEQGLMTGSIGIESNPCK